MAYWLVIHDAESYHQHPNWIGRRGGEIPEEFTRLKVGDGLIYYCKGDSTIVGTFRLKSRPRQISTDKLWPGPYTIAEIRKVATPSGDKLVPVKQMLKELPKSFSLFPDRILKGILLRGKTLLPLKKTDFDMVTRYIKQVEIAHEDRFKGRSNDAGLGEPGDYGVMNYAPTSEQGVVALFVHLMRDLGFEKLEFIRAGFPDACAIRKTGTTFERKFIEFEYNASAFRQHVNNPNHNQIRCDYVVCWEDDYYGCPVEVIALKSWMQSKEAMHPA